MRTLTTRRVLPVAVSLAVVGLMLAGAALAGPDEPVRIKPVLTATGPQCKGQCTMDGNCPLPAKLEALDAKLAEAKKLADAGNAKLASARIAEAQALLADARKDLDKCMPPKPAADSGKTVNDRCPIMGSKIDPAKVPDNLTRTYKGMKVGFCCAGCPAAWDKLTDDEKAAKLKAVMPAVQTKDVGIGGLKVHNVPVAIPHPELE